MIPTCNDGSFVLFLLLKKVIAVGWKNTPPTDVPPELMAAKGELTPLFKKSTSERLAGIIGADPEMLDEIICLGEWVKDRSGYGEQEVFSPKQVEIISMMADYAKLDLWQRISLHRVPI